MTASESDGWRLGLTLGVTLRLRQSNFHLVPGYGVDVYLPQHVRPREALFSPSAHTAFEDYGGDINAPRANVVLKGLGRPSNAARYFGLLHTFSLAVRWSERGPGFH
jgi:hypothetical protein